MGLPLFKEKRLNLRAKLTGLLPGRLQNSKGDDISARPSDVSKQGLGLVTEDQLNVGDLVTLTIDEQAIQLKIQWKKPDFAKMNLFRYGLSMVDTSIDLEEIFRKQKCLK